MRTFGILCLLVVSALTAVTVRPRAQLQAGPLGTLYGIGDLPLGPTGSLVLDATSVNDVIYAVGTGSVNTVNALNPDVPLLWKSDGTNSTLSALPNIVVSPTPTTFSAAWAISPDARFIASQIRASSTTFNGVRVENNGGVLTNVITGHSTARAVSDDGSVVYGNRPSGAGIQQVARWTGSLPIPFIDLLPGMNSSAVAKAGTSGDGLVMVGTSYVAPATSPLLPDQSGRAFRVVSGDPAPVNAIPVPAGSTWSQAVAVSSDGRFTLVQGNSAVYPLGEYYTHDAQTGTTTELGSPNIALRPTTLFGAPESGMTIDGVSAGTWLGPGTSFGYVHNSHGWFSVPAMLAGARIDFAAAGWDARGLTPTGVKTIDGKDLLFGRGRRGANVEGFVAALPAGYLANFNPQPTAPTDTSIVGAWSFQSATDPTNNGIVTFQKDGTFFQVSASGTTPGFERGLYTWNSGTGSIVLTLLQDTNGGRGLSDLDGSRDLTLTVAGNAATFTVPATNPNFTFTTIPKPMTLARITSGAGEILGGWVLGNPAAPNHSSLLTLLGDGTYYFATDGAETATAQDGIEKGTYTYDPVSHVFATTPSTDNDGTGGPTGVVDHLQLTLDELSLVANGPGGTSTFTRIVDPVAVTPSITSPLVAAGAIQAAFSYTVTATSGASVFGATHLPTGLTIDGSTGVISGTPTVTGSFNVGLTAANSQATGSATLELTIGNTATGSNVGVTPEVPAGTGPVSITFGNVTQSGDTTVTVDPSGPPPPSGFSLGSPATYFDVATTATFSGQATICFSYAGMSFTGAPRLFHYENSAWRDVTASVDSATSTICGMTTSFSPFAIFNSTIVRTGFFDPVNATAGYVNTVAAGSTVPLKFRVFVDGVQKTDTAGLVFSTSQIPCTGGVEDVVDFVTTGATSLRYDTDQFVQNWKTPKTPGACYAVRMTTTADGGSLTATFKMK